MMSFYIIFFNYRAKFCRPFDKYASVFTVMGTHLAKWLAVGQYTMLLTVVQDNAMGCFNHLKLLMLMTVLCNDIERTSSVSPPSWQCKSAYCSDKQPPTSNGKS